MFSTLDVSTSGLIAQRTRLDVISGNIANAKTILDENGAYEPYRRRWVELAAGAHDGSGIAGVRIGAIETDQGPLEMRYEPASPYADAEGYVGYPNVNTIIEQMNALEAARAYDANIAAVEATKSMMSVALQMIA